MARVTLSPLAASLSGRQDGITVRMTRHGPVLQRSHDAPAYDTAPAVAQKARFTHGVRTWSTMPTDLRALLTNAHTRAGHGSPGPWLTAWNTYVQTSTWDYTFCTDPDRHINLDHVTILDPNWRLWLDPPTVHPWTMCWYLITHPDGWITPHGWRINVGASTALYAIPLEDIPVGAVALCLPKDRFSEQYVGIGDSIALPQPP